MGALQIYKASAGAGKTYQLALKYITLLLGYHKDGRLHLFKGNDMRRHREILAITFTNKATQEMQRRIVDELALLADPNAKSDYREDLHRMIDPEDTDLRNTDIDRQVSLAATRALDSMLFDFGEMQISTIDSFFQRVLRSFAYEADLAGNYELMLENDRMTDMAISDLLAHACGMKGVVVPRKLQSDYLYKQIEELIKSQAEKGNEYKIFSADSNLRGEIIRFIKHLADEDYQNKKADIDTFLSQPDAISDLKNALDTKRSQLLNNLAKAVNQVTISTAAEKLSANAKTFLDRLATGDLTTTGKSAYFSRLFNPDTYDKFLNKNKFSEAEIYDFNNRLAELATALSAVNSVDALLGGMRFIGLFREILIVRQELQSFLNTILLSDTNELLNAIIDHCDSPFIYERIGRQLHHFLIDEFQDTSRMQWENLRPLLSESLATENDNLIIGDVKQCIYRFRNSSPELLATELDRTPRINSYIDHRELADNWRSSPVVVNFNNALFEAAGAAAKVPGSKAEAYGRVSQNAQKIDMPGYVDVDLIDSSDKAKAFERMFQHINRQLSSGYRAGDIVVLVRWNSDGRRCVEELLRAVSEGILPAGTMVVSDEALYVSSARSVKWIVNRLREINAPVDNRSKLNSRGLPRSTSEDIDWLEEQLLTQQSSGQTDALERVILDFNQHRGRQASEAKKRQVNSDGMALTELVEQLIRELPDKHLAESEVQHICAFQDLVLDYSRTKAPTLHGFLRLWDSELAKRAAVGLAEGVNAIRVMTIHKSKGLEFKCVHIPLIQDYLDRDSNTRWYDVEAFLKSLQLTCPIPKYFPLSPGSEDDGSSLLFTDFKEKAKELREDQTIDELNVLYVAFTRAVQELIVTFVDPRGKDKKRNPMPLNHASGLLCPIISRMAQSAEFPISFGSPTQKYKKKEEKELISSLQINGYTTCSRKEMWRQVRVSKTSDSGEKL